MEGDIQFYPAPSTKPMETLPNFNWLYANSLPYQWKVSPYASMVQYYQNTFQMANQRNPQMPKCEDNKEKSCSENESDNERFQCDYCEQSFEEKFELAVHKKTHWKIASYVCQNCYKSFDQKDILNTHTTTCKIFKCSNCSRTFTKCYARTNHLRSCKLKVPIDGKVIRAKVIDMHNVESPVTTRKSSRKRKTKSFADDEQDVNVPDSDDVQSVEEIALLLISFAKQ